MAAKTTTIELLKWVRQAKDEAAVLCFAIASSDQFLLAGSQGP